jgi:regulator of sirC expression with transglutaminase-like and TPR domain
MSFKGGWIDDMPVFAAAVVDRVKWVAMNTRAALVGVIALLSLAIAGTTAWRRLAPTPPAPEPLAAEEAPLPLPPVPPRIAEGEQYENCLAMLPDDPSDALAMAVAWASSGGGEGASHCLALARIALGNPAEGAQMLQDLAQASHGAAVARASVYEQAGQAWLIADEPDRALQAATLALSLSPDDPDLLIDRAGIATTLDKFQMAIDDLTRALAVDASRSDALVMRGAAWRHLDKLDLEALLERGILRQRHNDRTGARKDWERAITLAPESSAADLAQQNIALLDVGPDRR